MTKRKSNKKDIVKFLEEKGKEFAQELRDNATQWELKFKSILEELGYKFNFQVPVICSKKHLYILDFLLTDYQIFIELDGSQHFTKEGKKKDNLRTKRLKKEGYEPLRFPNKQIDNLTSNQIRTIIETKISLIKFGNLKKII